MKADSRSPLWDSGMASRHGLERFMPQWGRRKKWSGWPSRLPHACDGSKSRSFFRLLETDRRSFGKHLRPCWRPSGESHQWPQLVLIFGKTRAFRNWLLGGVRNLVRPGRTGDPLCVFMYSLHPALLHLMAAAAAREELVKIFTVGLPCRSMSSKSRRLLSAGHDGLAGRLPLHPPGCDGLATFTFMSARVAQRPQPESFHWQS